MSHEPLRATRDVVLRALRLFRHEPKRPVDTKTRRRSWLASALAVVDHERVHEVYPVFGREPRDVDPGLDAAAATVRLVREPPSNERDRDVEGRGLSQCLRSAL